MQALPFIGAASGVLQGVGGLLAGNANARAAREQAREEERAAAGQVRRVREDTRRGIGEQLAALGGGGFEGASSGGTALDLLRQSQVEAALDVLELRRQGALKARSLRREASLASREGKFALLGGFLGGASDFVRQRNDWAQAHGGEG